MGRIAMGTTTGRGVTLVTMALAAARPAPAQRPDPARVMDSILATWRAEGSPGCAVGVARDGRFVYRADAGLANIAERTPIGPGTTFYMASVSKQFAAAAVALASLQGKLSLDDDIRRYLPELPDYGRKITVADLLHHTSGIRDYLGLETVAGILGDVATDSAVVALIARQKALNFPTGSAYSYSNSGYFLLSVIVKRATGLSLAAFAERELFGPLGMRDTYFYDDHRQPHRSGSRRAIGYFPAKGGGFESGVLANFEQVGDGGLFSTVEDVLKWDRNFADGRVGGAKFLEMIQTPGRLADGTAHEYALGLMIRDYGGLRTVGHSGVFMGYRTLFQRFPSTGLSVIMLCNLGTASPEDLVQVIADAFLADELAAAQRPLTGEYWSQELGVGWTIRADGGRLAVDRGRDRLILKSQGKDQYTMDTPLGRANLKFLRENDRVIGLEAGLGPRTTGVRFDRR